MLGTALRQGRSSVVSVEEMNGCGNVAKLRKNHTSSYSTSYCSSICITSS